MGLEPLDRDSQQFGLDVRAVHTEDVVDTCLAERLEPGRHAAADVDRAPWFDEVHQQRDHAPRGARRTGAGTENLNLGIECGAKR